MIHACECDSNQALFALLHISTNKHVAHGIPDSVHASILGRHLRVW